MLRMNPDVRTTKPRRALITGALAIAGLAAVAYGLHDASVAHARFDYANDGIFRNQQNPDIASMVLINGNTAQTVFDAARQVGFDQTLALGGGVLAAVSGAKVGADLTPMTNRTRSTIHAGLNLALLAGGLGTALYGIHDGAFAQTTRFDYTNDGVFRDAQYPKIADMVLINGNTAQTVFDAARQTGLDQGLVFGGLTLAASPFAEAMAQPARRKPSHK